MKNEKRILCICDTPMQLLNMINCIDADFHDDKRDLVITDEVKDIETLIANIKKTGFFDTVFIVKEDYMQAVYIHKNIILKAVAFLQYKKRIQKSIHCSECYDRIFFGGWGLLNNIVAKKCKKNKNAEYIWVDEGTSSYCAHGDFWREKKVHENTVSAFAKKVLGMEYLQKHTTMQYLYRPELADYTVPFERKQLRLLGQHAEFLPLINNIFGFDEQENMREKFIYFDTALETDGLTGNDKELLQLVASCVGKENLLVKVHPRSSKDWYIRNGFHINTNTFIPWEVYCLNGKAMSGKVLISIFSTAIFSLYMYFGMNTPVVSLIHMFDISSFSPYRKRLIEYLRNICMKEPSVFHCPTNEDELKNILHTINI